jgi:hypothetical protein
LASALQHYRANLPKFFGSVPTAALLDDRQT